MKLILASLALTATGVCAQRSNKAMFGRPLAAVQKDPYEREDFYRDDDDEPDRDEDEEDMIFNLLSQAGLDEDAIANLLDNVGGGLDVFFDDGWTAGDSRDDWPDSESSDWMDEYGSSDWMDEYGSSDWMDEFGSSDWMDEYGWIDEYGSNDWMDEYWSDSYDEGYAYDDGYELEDMKSYAWCGELDASFIKWCSSSWKQKRACDTAAHATLNTLNTLLDTWNAEGTSFDQLPGMVGDLLLMDPDSSTVLSGGMSPGGDLQEIFDEAGYVYSQDGRSESLNFVCHLDLSTSPPNETGDAIVGTPKKGVQSRRANPTDKRLAKVANRAAKTSSKDVGDTWRSFIIAAPIVILE